MTKNATDRIKLIIFCLGWLASATSILGAALVAILDEFWIPLFSAIAVVGVIQWLTLRPLIKSAEVLAPTAIASAQTTDEAEAIRRLLKGGRDRSLTQRLFLGLPVFDVAHALILRACDQQDHQLLKDVITSLVQDFGEDYLEHWLKETVFAQLHEDYLTWFLQAIGLDSID